MWVTPIELEPNNRRRDHSDLRVHFFALSTDCGGTQGKSFTSGFSANNALVNASS